MLHLEHLKAQKLSLFKAIINLNGNFDSAYFKFVCILLLPDQTSKGLLIGIVIQC